MLRYVESSHAVFIVTLSSPSGLPVTVDYATADGTATAGSDYEATSGTLTIPPGVTSRSIIIPTVNDNLEESVETFSVDLSNPSSGVVIIDDQATATITDATSPRFVIHDVSQLEGDSGTSEFVSTIARIGDTTDTATVEFATANGTAIASEDYLAVSGQLLFDPGEVEKDIVVTVNGDIDIEEDESFLVSLFNASGAAIEDSEAVATIIGDDVSIAISDVTVTEGDDSGQFVDEFATLGIDGAGFSWLAFGPDGNLYAEVAFAGSLSNTIARFDGDTGTFIDVFIPNSYTYTTRALIFRDGVLYVSDLDDDKIVMFDAVTGAYQGVFVGDDPATPDINEAGTLDSPEGMLFGPDANGDGLEDLYVAGWRSNNIVRFDGVTGEYIDTFVSGLLAPTGLEYHNGSIFVTNQTNEILEYNLAGALIRTIGSSADGLSNPLDVKIGPDDGLLYVASGSTSKVVRYDIDTSAYVDDFVPTGYGGLEYSRSLAFRDGVLFVTSGYDDSIRRYTVGSSAVFAVELALPVPHPVSVDFQTVGATATSRIGFRTNIGNFDVLTWRNEQEDHRADHRR